MLMQSYPHTPYRHPQWTKDDMHRRATEFYDLMKARRSIRFFSDQEVERDLIEQAIKTAATAPSGAHRQPWRFVAVNDAALKHKMRVAAEEEEYESYHGRMSDEWLNALAPLGTDWRKPFLETAPWLVVCFAESYGVAESGAKIKNYYVQESCGIACGLFIAAIHYMGLVTLTHTPSPMRFLADILQRPKNERPYMLFPVGYPAEEATVPDLARKPIEDVVQWNLGQGEASV